MGRKNHISLVVFAILIIAAPSLFGDSFSRLIPIGTLAMVTIGLSLLMGYAGQISLGQGAFYAIGAYTSSVLTVDYGWSIPASFLLGILLTLIVAIIVGLPALRLRGHYLAMATLAFGEIVHILLDARADITGGVDGHKGASPITVKLPGMAKAFEFDSWFEETAVFYLIWTVVFIAMVLALNLIHSRMGRGLRAIHDGEEAASVLGVPVARMKVQVFLISAVFAAVGGSLYAHTTDHITPSTFSATHSIMLVVMVVIGGMRTVWGALAGAVILGMLPEWLSFFDQTEMIVFGLILLVIMMFVPQGLLLGSRDLIAWAWTKVRPPKAEAKP